LWDTLAEQGHWQGEICNRYRDGSVHTEWLTISAVRDSRGQIRNFVGLFRDITEIKQTQERLEYLAHRDPLTGLPNRLVFNARLEHAIARANRDGTRIAVLFLDLDRFKDVNDSLGHAAGDELLREVARRLSARLREADTLARQGGDEFVVLLDRVEEPEDAAVVARKLLAALDTPIRLQGQDLYLSVSIGISLSSDQGNDQGNDAEILIRNADTAMYRAKEGGRHSYTFYAEDFTDQARKRLQLLVDLRKALELGQLRLLYQPQFALADGRMTGAEALLRWQHPDLGELSPAGFLSLAEESELICSLGAWVLVNVCRDTMALERAGLSLKRVAVNLSPVQLSAPGFVESVQTTLQQAGLDPRRLELELKEAAVMRQPGEYSRVLERLRALGIRLALDHFGIGSASLGLLKRLPIDRLKIDRKSVV
jgi:diguanylate cyclase (GGDEF)-like protein